MNYKELAKQELVGKVWFMPTDTIPGLSCLAVDKKAVDKITALKERDSSKIGYIVLIASLEQMELFGVFPSPQELAVMNKMWPGAYTIIPKVRPTKHLHVTSIDEPVAFRVPDDEELRDLLEKVGPMVSTSCNKSGKPVLLTPQEAQREFGEQIDYYLEVSENIINQSSTLIKIIR